MQNVFITKLLIDKVRNLKNIEIELSDTVRSHLILTGKNGSGKSSLLEALRNSILFAQQQSYRINKPPDVLIQKWARILFNDIEISKPTLDISYSADIDNYLDVTFVYISTARNEQIVPKAIEPVDIQGKNIIIRNAGNDFLKYILNLYFQYLSAKDSNATSEEVARYSKWFENFTNALREIYDCPQLELKPDMKNFAFQVVLPGREPFSLHEMSGGYKAFFDIYTELLLRMEGSDILVDYESPAIVLIDEIEIHLHVELQKRILPFLTKTFPNVQFIVSTHSPFVITSVDNAVVFDLDHAVDLQLRGESVDGARLDSTDAPLTTYSYEDIIEGYYDVGSYSEIFIQELERYKALCGQDSLTLDERNEMLNLKCKMDRIPSCAKLLRYEINAFENRNDKK
jgi:AAA15 family ATPase/GTPase